MSNLILIIIIFFARSIFGIFVILLHLSFLLFSFSSKHHYNPIWRTREFSNSGSKLSYFFPLVHTWKIHLPYFVHQPYIYIIYIYICILKIQSKFISSFLPLNHYLFTTAIKTNEILTSSPWHVYILYRANFSREKQQMLLHNINQCIFVVTPK